jgi:hypothetical protein
MMHSLRYGLFIQKKDIRSQKNILRNVKRNYQKSYRKHCHLDQNLSLQFSSLYSIILLTN